MDRFTAGMIVCFALALGLIVWAFTDSNRRAERRCTELMTYAHTSRDTLDVKIECARISDAASSQLTTAVAAGAVTGAVAGSASR